MTTSLCRASQVGYSYCGSGTGHGAAPKCKWDDHTQAVANYGALLSFFDSFPEQAAIPSSLLGSEFPNRFSLAAPIPSPFRLGSVPT